MPSPIRNLTAGGIVAGAIAATLVAIAAMRMRIVSTTSWRYTHTCGVVCLLSGRFVLGGWLDDCRRCGVEASYFFLGTQRTTFSASASGLPGTLALARPFFDVVSGREASELIAFPGVLAGRVAISSASRLWGAEINLRENVRRGPCWQLDVLYGFRYVSLDENLNVVAPRTSGRWRSDGAPPAWRRSCSGSSA